MSRHLTQLAKIPVTELTGVTVNKLKSLNELGIATVLDLVTMYPRKYVDRSNQKDLIHSIVGEEFLVVGEVLKVSAPRRSKSNKTVVDLIVTDGTSKLWCTFFNQPWRTKQLENEKSLAIFGKVSAFKGKLTMVNPIVDLIGNQTGKIIALYPTTERSDLTNVMISGFIHQALQRSKEFADPLSEINLRKYDLISRTEAFNNIHFPESTEMLNKARKRLAFDELLRLQMPLLAKKMRLQNLQKGFKSVAGGLEILNVKGSNLSQLTSLVGDFLRILPFELTSSQKRVIKEVLFDMAKPYPMHRLLQGDVGSGKTVVALACLIAAIENGHQGALMAPTEVLAEQHYLNIVDMTRHLKLDDLTSLFNESNFRVALLSGKLTPKLKSELLIRIEKGEINLVVGTHALISQAVRFKSLGAIVIDEQHRFGVEQRSQLLAKSSYPDTLTMTATPIPRSAAMTVFGDLDQSILDEMPHGRQIIDTFWVTKKGESRIWKKVLEEIEHDNRVFIVCPLIEDSEKISAASVAAVAEELASGPLKGINTGILHGQIPPLERQKIFEEFRSGKFKVLISTTVVEVGVDVRDATVMVILDADRFGIAQLHQLRGRVGRSEKKSYCFLLTKGSNLSDIAKGRLNALVKSNNGFELSEIDFALRGFGTLMGTRQKGRSDLKLAKLPSDEQLLLLVKEFLNELAETDRTLEQSDLSKFLRAEVLAFHSEEDTEFLMKS